MPNDAKIERSQCWICNKEFDRSALHVCAECGGLCCPDCTDEWGVDCKDCAATKTCTNCKREYQGMGPDLCYVCRHAKKGGELDEVGDAFRALRVVEGLDKVMGDSVTGHVAMFPGHNGRVVCIGCRDDFHEAPHILDALEAALALGEEG